MKTVTGFKDITEALQSGKTILDIHGNKVLLKDDEAVNEEGFNVAVNFRDYHEIIEDEPELFYIWYVKKGFVSDYYFNKDKKAFDNELAEYLHKIAYTYPAIDKDFNEYKYNFETKKWEIMNEKN